MGSTFRAFVKRCPRPCAKPQLRPRLLYRVSHQNEQANGPFRSLNPRTTSSRPAPYPAPLFSLTARFLLFHGNLFVIRRIVMYETVIAGAS